MNKRKLVINLFIPLALGIIFSFVAYATMKLEVERQVNARPRLPPVPVETRAVLVPIRNITVGETISSENLAMRRLSSDALPTDAIAVERLEDIVGYKTKVSIHAGKPLQQLHLQEMNISLIEKLSDNYYPFTVKAEPDWTHDKAFQLGDSVSIYQQKANRWELLVSQAPILRLSPLQTHQSTIDYDFVTFGVPQNQLALLNELSYRSKLKFVISNGRPEPILRSFVEPELIGVSFGVR